MTLISFSRSHRHFKSQILIEKSLCAYYFLNQWLEFYQTSTRTSLGHGKEVIGFWWPWPHFQGNYIIKWALCAMSGGYLISIAYNLFSFFFWLALIFSHRLVKPKLVNHHQNAPKWNSFHPPSRPHLKQNLKSLKRHFRWKHLQSKSHRPRYRQERCRQRKRRHHKARNQVPSKKIQR